MRKSLLALLALVLGLGLFSVGVSAASATTDDGCKTIVSHLVDRPDNSANGVWATLDMDRTVKICPDAVQALRDTTLWSYTAIVTDDGTLETTGPKSPRQGVTLAAHIMGTVKGEYTEKFKAPADWEGFTPETLQGMTFTGAGPGIPTTGEWVKTAWPSITANTLDPYKWTYTTCTETWISSPATNDGNDPLTAGDITGLPCPVVIPPATTPPVATTSPNASTTTSTQTSAPVASTSIPVVPGGTTGNNNPTLAIVPLGNDHPRLPITGSSGLVPVMWSGAVLVVLGALGLFWVARRRRDVTG